MGGWDQPSHWLIIIVIAALLFGYKKLPDMARSAGRSMRLFKTEVKGMADDDEARREHDATKQAQAAAPAETTASAPAPAAPAPAAPQAQAAAAQERPGQHALPAAQPTTVTRAADPTAPTYE